MLCLRTEFVSLKSLSHVARSWYQTLGQYLAAQIGFKEAGRHSVEFVEEWGRLLNLGEFFLFGLIVVRAFPQFNLAVFTRVPSRP